MSTLPAAKANGLSEPAFLERFGSEGQCVEFLIRMRWGQGLVCERCGHTGFARMRCRKQARCNRCKHQTGFTTGTGFHGKGCRCAGGFSATTI